MAGIARSAHQHRATGTITVIIYNHSRGHPWLTRRSPSSQAPEHGAEAVGAGVLREDRKAQRRRMWPRWIGPSTSRQHVVARTHPTV